jgi:hypothetical protein
MLGRIPGKKKGALTQCWQKCKLVQLLWKSGWSFLTKLKIILISYSLTTPGYVSKRIKVSLPQGTRPAMFISALFPMAKLWNYLVTG